MPTYINPDLDRAAIADHFQRHHRVLVRNFFVPEVADALERALVQADWGLSFHGQQGDGRLTVPELNAMSSQQREGLNASIQATAERGFAFSFFSHLMVANAEAGQTDLLSRFVRWMAGEALMAPVREMTGMPDIARVYAMGTMYQRGSFLALHDDHVDRENRRVAYVLNLTRHWRADWGGLLHFPDEDGGIAETFYPHFNSVSLFRVPQDHFVSYVTPYAMGARRAITGWFIGQ